MRAALWIGILAFVSLFGIVACGGSGGDNKPPPPAATSPILTGINPAANDSSVLLGNSLAATFDKNMNAATASTFVVYGNQTGKRT